MNIWICDTDIIFHDKKNKGHLWLIRKNYVAIAKKYVIRLMSIYPNTCYNYKREFDIIKAENDNNYYLEFDNRNEIEVLDYFNVLLKSQELDISNEAMNKFIDICNKCNNK